MGDAAKWWRADGGFQDVPADREATAPTPLQSPLPNMYFFPSYMPSYGSGYSAFYGNSFAPWIMPQGGCVEGPVGIGGLFSPPPPYAAGGLAPAPTPACAPPPTPPPEAEKMDSRKKEEKRKQKKPNPWAAPKIPEGANYMFDCEHTMLHIFHKAAPIWTEKYRRQELKFKMFKVSVNFTVKMVIENTLKKTGDDCKGWAATEAVERGDGHWDKGTTIEYESDKARGTLKSMGWTTKRGDSLPPVWIVVHKVDFQ